MSFKIHPFNLITMILFAASTLNIATSPPHNCHSPWRNAPVVWYGRPLWKVLAATVTPRLSLLLLLCFLCPPSSHHIMPSNYRPMVSMPGTRPQPWPPPCQCRQSCIALPWSSPINNHRVPTWCCFSPNGNSLCVASLLPTM